MSDRGRPLSLWGSWWNAIELLRPAFSRLSTFMWFATIVAGMTVRVGHAGRHQHRAGAEPAPRRSITGCSPTFTAPASSSTGSPRCGRRWCCGCSQRRCRVNGRLILVGDGIKCPKRGKKMPAVKLLHQQSDANTKPEYIMGHSLQAVSLLVHAAHSFFAVPLAARIHEGLVWSNRDRRTLLDKMLALLGLARPSRRRFTLSPTPTTPPARSLTACIAQGHHLVSRVKSNAVAYAPAEPPKGKQKEGAAKTLWQEDQSSSPCLSDPQSMQRTGQSGLRRAQCHAALSRLRSDLASGRTTCPLRRRHSSRPGGLPVDVHRSRPERRRHHLSLWPALQDRAQLQTGDPA